MSESMSEPDEVAGDVAGVQAVDDVLAGLAALDERPVDEHVEVFEQAHDRLRRALDSQP